MGRRRLPPAVKELRRRLRRLHGLEINRLAAAAGVTRGTLYMVRSGATRIPRPATLEALTSGLDALHPLRRPAAKKLLEVQSTMTETLFDNPKDAEFGAEVFEICDIAAHHHSEFNSVVDFDAQASDAVFALSRGEPLETVLNHIQDVDVHGRPAKHPASDEVRVALRELHAQFYGGKV